MPLLVRPRPAGGCGGAATFHLLLIAAVAAAPVAFAALPAPALLLLLLPGAEAFAAAWVSLAQQNQQPNLLRHERRSRIAGAAGSTTSTIMGMMITSPAFSSIISPSSSPRRRRPPRPSPAYRGSFSPNLFLLNVNGDGEDGSIVAGDSGDAQKFSEFASSLLADEQGGGGGGRTAAGTAALKAKSTTTTSTYRRPSGVSTAAAAATWKRDLDELLNVSTSNARRQALLQRLLNSNQEIRRSVEQALKDRTIDPLLTPQTKKIQDGTRAVARQVTSDILPGLAQTAAASSQQRNRRRGAGDSSSTPPPNDWFPSPPVPPLSLASMEAAVADISKVGDRLLNIAQRQFQRGLDEISRDLADPSRIPDRVSKQASELARETLNVFAETPIDLKGPSYRAVLTTDDYEIRDYGTYRVASTRAANADADLLGGGTSAVDAWAQDGAAFATLASYVLGGNQESQVLEMTTPVTTTMTGEMRFYLAIPDDMEAPQPMDASAGAGTAAVEIQTLPPARLAVRKFPGFVTDGEVSRQKQALLTALELDGIELDVRHGQTVPHVIFQYNPPYTVPVLRRNEIAVPVVGPSDQVEAELRMGGRDALNDEFWSDDA